MILALVLGLGVLPAVAGSATAEDPFADLRFLAGHCWRGDFGNGSVDTQCYELLYDGAFLRSIHEVKRGDEDTPSYGGITLFSWDGQAKRVRFHYFSRDGAVSEGYFASDAEGIVIPERHVSPDGSVMEIETRYDPLDADSYEVVSRSLKDGEWRLMFQATYRRVDAD